MKARGTASASMGDFRKAAKKKVAPVKPALPEGADREESERAFTAFLERVSDSIFGRRDWEYLPEAESRAIGEAVATASEASAEAASAASAASAFKVKRFPLSFYEKAALLELREVAGGIGGGSTWVLENEGVFYRLDGSSAPIHDVNEAASIKVSRDTAVDYVRFFCFFVNGDEGPFFIVDSLDHPVFIKDKIAAKDRETREKALREPEVLEVTAEGTFIVSAVVMYGNALFDAKLAVTETGLIEMIDDEPIAGDIPALKLKTDY